MWLCFFSFKRFEDIFEMHSGEKSNKCNQYGYTSSQASNLRTHMKMHSGEKSHKWDQCDYVSAYASVLRTHLKTHGGEKSHKCNQCDYAASYASILRTDLKMHCGEKSNKCNQCDNASSLAGNLRKRLKTHSMHCSSPLSNIKLDPFVFIISYQPKAKSHLDIQIPPMVGFCKLKVWKRVVGSEELKKLYPPLDW